MSFKFFWEGILFLSSLVDRDSLTFSVNIIHLKIFFFKELEVNIYSAKMNNTQKDEILFVS